MKTRVHIKRVYDAPDAGDGRRILVDRLWPRGLTKEKAKIDYWAKDDLAVQRSSQVVRPRARQVGRVQEEILRRAGQE